MKLSILLSSILVSSLLVTSVLAFGVSPPRISIEDIPKETSLTKQVLVTGVEPGSTIKVSLQGEGKEWINLPLGDEFVHQQGNQFMLPFEINVPSKVPNGDYKVRAQVLEHKTSNQEQGNNAAISLGAFIDFHFTVTGKQVTKYRIVSVSVPAVEQGDPLFVVMKIDNQGNVVAKPSSVQIEVSDVTRQKILFTDQTSVMSGVDPYSSGESIVQFPVSLAPGQYFTNLVLHNNEGSKNYTHLPFEILEKGSRDSHGRLEQFVVQQNPTSIAKIQALFANIGSANLNAKMLAEVYLDNQLIDHIQTEPQFVAIDRTQEFIHYYDLEKSGTYKIVGFIEYANKRTEPKEVTFTIEQQQETTSESQSSQGQEEVSESSSSSSTNLHYGFLAIALVIIALLIFYFRRVRRNDEWEE